MNNIRKQESRADLTPSHDPFTEDVKTAQKLGAGKYIKKPYTMAKIGIAVKEELEK